MRSSIDALVDTAESERKYWGGESVGLLHLAVAVAKHDPDAFKEAFGDEGMDLVKASLRSAPFDRDDSSDCDAVLAVAREHTNSADALRVAAVELRTRLQWIFDTAEGGESAAGPTPGHASAIPSAVRGANADKADTPSDGLRLLIPDERPLRERREQVDELVVMLARRKPLVPLLVGREGSGRTTLLRALAARLSAPDYDGPLRDTEVLEPTPEMRAAPNLTHRLGQIVNGAGRSQIVCIDDLEVLLAVSGMGMNGSMLAGLRQLIDDETVRFVFSVDQALLPQLSMLAPEFVASLAQLEVDVGSGESIGNMLVTSAAELADAHGIDIPADIVEVAATVRPSHAGPVQPGLGISMLDSACVRATMRRGSRVEVQDLRGADRSPRRLDHPSLRDALQRSVVGQSHVADQVASRLALTQAGLDLRPERPDGVFLFVGPTGVGKTEMAKAITREVFGDEDDHLIRLDMSEYVHDWSVSRLIGPQPGYVGSNEPSAWLTTKVVETPRCVLLLDEIEKAHPVVWNTFLQVFDAGRLTDSRGEIADFSSVVVIMTSNLGAEAYSRRRVGFGVGAGSMDQAESEAAEVVRRSLSPELINRLDETLMFRPLSPEHILSIARELVRGQVQRIAGLGYELTVDDDVVEHLAATGYEPAYGARHLQRNVDRQLLAPLALAGDGVRFRARLAGGEVRWSAIGAG